MITLKTLPQATAQEVFDQVAKHLLTQNAKSSREALPSDNVIEGVICLYRSPGGLKCAAGCLIGDDEYDPLMEGRGWSYLSKRAGRVPLDHTHLICDLQNLHDSYFIEDWVERLKEISKIYGLEYKF